MTKSEFIEYVAQEYAVEPDYPFANDFDGCVLRHKSNKKWFAIFMRVQRNKIGLNGDDYIDILDVKCDPLLLTGLLSTKGVYPAYHMNKSHWLTLNFEEISDDDLKTLVDISFNLTACKNKIKKTK